METADNQNGLSISDIRGKVQIIINRKEDYLKTRDGDFESLSIIDFDDINKLSLIYHHFVVKNSVLMDLVIDIKNEIFKIKLIKEQLDKNTSVGISQNKVLDNLINLLNEANGIMLEEKQKLDRVVRFYEKSFTYYSNNY